MLESNKTSTPAPPRTRKLRAVVLCLIGCAAAFAAGYLPKHFEGRELEQQLAEARLEGRLLQLHRLVGVASHEAQRNNYASAAAAARDFFRGCEAAVQEESFATQPRTRVALSGYAASGREIEALLTSADPQARERLAGIYLAMHGVLQRHQ